MKKMGLAAALNGSDPTIKAASMRGPRTVRTSTEGFREKAKKGGR